MEDIRAASQLRHMRQGNRRYVCLSICACVHACACGCVFVELTFLSGTRFKCLSCPDYDMCASCMKKGTQQHSSCQPRFLCCIISACLLNSHASLTAFRALAVSHTVHLSVGAKHNDAHQFSEIARPMPPRFRPDASTEIHPSFLCFFISLLVVPNSCGFSLLTCLGFSRLLLRGAVVHNSSRLTHCFTADLAVWLTENACAAAGNALTPSLQKALVTAWRLAPGMSTNAHTFAYKTGLLSWILLFPCCVNLPACVSVFPCVVSHPLRAVTRKPQLCQALTLLVRNADTFDKTQLRPFLDSMQAARPYKDVTTPYRMYNQEMQAIVEVRNELVLLAPSSLFGFSMHVPSFHFILWLTFLFSFLPRPSTSSPPHLKRRVQQTRRARKRRRRKRKRRKTRKRVRLPRLLACRVSVCRVRV